MAMKFTARLVRLFIHQYKIKLFCLVSALFFWFYITLESQFEYTASVPLRVVNPPDGWMLLEPLPSSVSVLFKGSGRSYVSFRFGERMLDVDMRNIRNNARIPLTADMIKNLPSGVRVMSVLSPEEITVRWDRLAEKKVPVVPRIEAIPEDGYTLVGEIRLDPDSILIVGPQSILDSISAVQTEARVLTGLIREIQDKVPLEPVSGGVLHFSERSVRFQTDVQRIGERWMRGIPVRPVNVPEGSQAAVVPSSLSIKLQGGADLLSRIKPEDIQATIDYSERSRYQGKQLPALIRIPRDVTFSEVDPRYFQLAVKP
jgi:YbbR domain-containing protein